MLLVSLAVLTACAGGDDTGERRTQASGEIEPPTKQVSEIQLAQYSQTSEVAAPKPAATQQVTSIALSRKTWEKRLAAAQASSTETSTAAESAAAPSQPSR